MPSNRALAGAGVAAGAAAAAGAALLARRDGEDGDADLTRKYRIRRTHPIASEAARLVATRIDHARSGLTGEEDKGTAIHEARKDLKKARSVLRLIRDSLGDDSYRRQNRRLRDIGRRLSEARDARVTLDSLEAEAGGEDAPAVSELRDELRTRRAAEEDFDVTPILDGLEEAQREVSEWHLGESGFDLMALGLRRVYRQARRARRRAAESGADDDLHEWRKRAKDHWYHLRLLRRSWPPLMEPAVDAAGDLGDLLGEDHDLATLTCELRARDPDLPLLDDLESRRHALQASAADLSDRLFAEKPGPMARRLERYFKAWRA
jgi:CHAD domain-containing protein